MNELKVEPYDAPGRYFVHSESRHGEKHLVDLMCFSGFGECACEHFQMRIVPELRNERPVKPCKHIIASKLALADDIIAKMISNALAQSAR